MTDAGLLAEAMVWAATDPAAANQAYNITNGDMFRWEEMWPKIADYFGVPVAPGLPLSLADVMADKEPAWQEVVARHGLAPTPYRDVSSWAFGDAVFSWDYDLIADGSKARRHGFHRYVETAEMFPRIFDEMRARKIIPPA
jgi:nucleoside-diphosphate-sugar epimerase